MITKGIIEEKIDEYSYRVRLPIFDGIKSSANGKPNSSLRIATLCTMPFIKNSIVVGNIVFVGFEDNDMGKPIILGTLACSKNDNMINKSILSTSGVITDELQVKDSATLPKSTMVGEVTYSSLIKTTE